MFAHAIATDFQKRNFLEEFFAPKPVEQRYCPVNDHSRGPAQYLERHEPTPALVAEDRSQVCDQPVDDQDLWDYIRDSIANVVPNPKAIDVSKSAAFHDVTDKQLPLRYFTNGDVLLWDRQYIPENHAARRYCGEGPFLVLRDESNQIEIGVSNYQVISMRVGKNQLILMNLRNRNIVIAHRGFFFKRSQVLLQYRLADTHKVARLSRSAV